MTFLTILVLALSFGVMFKSADWFITGASAFARILNIPKLTVGIVIVGLATTAPELGVSVQAAFLKHSEIALGNAIGSVICDDGIALALAALFAPAVIMVNCKILKTAGIFLLSIDLFAYLLARNGTVGRVEGVLFILILGLYYFFILRYQRGRKGSRLIPGDEIGEGRPDARARIEQLKKPVILFLFGITGVIVASRLVVWAAVRISHTFGVSETVISLTVIAIGTSLPEISTCVAAAVKGEGEIAVGNIIGADILNVLWIIGASAVVNPIKVEVDVINFTFPYMILVVFTMLAAMRIGCRLGKAKGLLLLALYILYLFLTLKFFT